MKSVAVVGGGVIGLFCAYYAMQRGHRVTLLERGAPSHDCCSLGNAGMVVPSHFVPLAAPGMVQLGLRMLFNPESPFALRPGADPGLLDWCWKFFRSCTAEHVRRAGPLLRDLNLASRGLYASLADECGWDFGLARRGLLMLCRSAHALAEERALAQSACSLGLAAEVLSPEEIARLEPGVRMSVAGGVYFPQDCHLVPERLVRGLAERLCSDGADLRWSTPVTGVELRDGRIEGLETGEGVVSADEYVIAGGAWSGRLAGMVGHYLPLQAGKGYSLTVPGPRTAPKICAILTEARVAMTPMDASLRFAGTMEIAGLDQSVNAGRIRGLKRSIPTYYPDFPESELEALPVWSGLRPCSPDGVPYIGRSSLARNLCVATGHAMMGVSLAPVTGKIIADLLSDEPPAFAQELLSPDRFA